MPITYTNRKGQTYFLCQGKTKTGKTRYFFSKTAGQNTLEEIPEGYRIEESVNGIVSLTKDRPQPILPEELQVVEAALRQIPQGETYRAAAKGKQIIIYEQLGMLPDVLAGLTRLFHPENLDEVLAAQRALLDKSARFSPMLRFNLVDAQARRFCTERKTYSASFDREWIEIGGCESLPALVEQIIPLFDTDDFYELL